MNAHPCVYKSSLGTLRDPTSPLRNSLTVSRPLRLSYDETIPCCRPSGVFSDNSLGAEFYVPFWSLPSSHWSWAQPACECCSPTQRHRHRPVCSLPTLQWLSFRAIRTHG